MGFRNGTHRNPTVECQLTSMGRVTGHDSVVTELDCGKRLQMLFLSPHSKPSCVQKRRRGGGGKQQHLRSQLSNSVTRRMCAKYTNTHHTLYTKTIASVWAMANFEESGENAIAGTTYGVVP